MVDQSLATPTPEALPARLVVDRGALFHLLLLVWIAALAGLIWSVRPAMSPNDQSRWNTVWSLVELGTYAFDESRQYNTIDKVRINESFYSSKPPLMPTIIAGYCWVLQKIFREPFSKENNDQTQRLSAGLFIYSKATIYLFQLVPFVVYLLCFRAWTERFARSDYSWGVSLLSAATGTYVTGYMTTLNNHTLAACLGFLTAYGLYRIWFDRVQSARLFGLVGLAAGFTTVNELPAVLLALVGCGVCFAANRRLALLAYFPALGTVAIAFLVTNWLAVGSVVPAYLQKDKYRYEGSYWNKEVDKTVTDPKKSGIDALNDQPESKLVYFLHLTIGHHGFFSLSPILLFAFVGAWEVLRGRGTLAPTVVIVVIGISSIVFCFYWLINDQRNYGGFCHGPRWLMWLVPLWLMFLPMGIDRLRLRHGLPTVIGLSLAISVMSMADTWINPWTRSWLHRVFFYFGWINY